jgi:hypothetical protein
MPPRLVPALIALGLVTAPALADETCPTRFRDYGRFLQAKRSCGREAEYPLMKMMKACAKETPKESALNLMDDGRREWARGVMRSSLGSMCEEVFSKLSASAKDGRRSLAKEP